MNEYSSTLMESKASTKREGFISPSWLLCWIVFLLSWSVFISRTDLYDGKVFGQYFYFNRIAGLSLFAFGIFYIFYQKIKVVRISVASYILLSYSIYIIFHVWYKSTYVDVRLGSQLMCIFLALMFSIERTKTIYILFSVWICGCIEAIWGIIQLYHHFYDWKHYDNPVGSLYNSGLLGIYLCIPFVSALVSSKKNVIFLSRNQYYAFNIVRYQTLILTGVLLPFTGSRTAWVGVIGGIIAFLLQQGRIIRHFRMLPIVLKILLIIIIGIIAYSVSFQLYHFKENSSFGRLLIWKVSLLNWKDNPIFGTGINSFANNYFTYQAQYFGTDRPFKEQWVAGTVNYAFNDFLQLAIEYGIIGLLLFTSIFIFIFRGIKSTYLAVLVACLLTGQSYYPLENIATQLHWFIFLGLCLSEKEPTTILKVPRFALIIIGIGLGSLGLFLLIKNQEQDENEKNSFNAEKLFQAEQYTEAINMYRQIPNISASNLLVYGKALALNGNHSKAVTILERAKNQISEPFLCNNLGISYQALKKYKQAEENFKLSHQMIPSLIYPKYLLAKLYIEEGNVSKARKQAIEVINSPIKVHSEAAEEMKEELRVYISQNTFK